MQVKTAIQRYVKQLKEKGYAEKTISEYERFLGDYLLFLSADGTHVVKDITGDLNNAYVKERFYVMNQFGRQNSVGTRNNEIKAIRSFMRFLVEQELIKCPLADGIRHYRKRMSRIPKDILTKLELIKLFKQPDTSTLTGYRDRMMMEVLYATGMRRNELRCLRVDDIDYQEKTVLIREGKGSKDRVVPINETALSYIRNYVEDVRPKLMKQYKSKQDTKRLVVGSEKAEIHENTITSTLKIYFKQAKLKKKVTVHSFRHTCATHLLQKGMPLRHVQELLGHEKLDTTIRYLSLSVKDLQREYRRYHPRSRLP